MKTKDMNWKRHKLLKSTILIMFYLVSISVFSQNLTVRGTVANESGETLIGVTVKVLKTNIGTLTDSDGAYTLLNVPSNGQLEVSYVGMKSQIIPVNSRGLINVVLAETNETLDEVVVVGYGTQKKENLTGAVSSITSKVLENRPLANLAQGLQGTISNLNITQSNGSLGAGPGFNVRGYTSINGGSPLVLVNGVSMSPTLINPNDVESVTVLKDGASSAIYGARAAFGVILITTKSGKKNQKPEITFTSNLSINQPTIKMEMFDSKDIMNFYNQAWRRMNGTDYFDEITTNAILAHYNDPTQPSAIVHEDPTAWTGVANTDWPDILMNDYFPMQQYGLSLSGETERINYYTSLSYFHQQGITKKEYFNEYYNRYNLLSDIKYKIADWITAGTRIAINNSYKKFPPNDPWYRNTFPEEGTIHHQNWWALMPYKFPNGLWGRAGTIPNPAYFLSEGGFQARSINDVWVTGTLKLTPFKNFSFNADYTTNVQNTSKVQHVKKLSFYRLNEQFSSYYPGSNPSRVIRNSNKGNYNAFNAFADYFIENDNHYFKVMMGFNQEYADYLYYSAEAQNLISDDLPYMNLATGDRFVGDSESEYAIRGIFGRINYSYKKRYLLEINARYDGSSRFPKESRYALFPSASVGWAIHNEPFFESLKKNINTLKPRLSYGSLGNQLLSGYYPYVSTMGTGRVDYIIGDELPQAVYAPNLVSSDLTWEVVSQVNAGIDFGFFNNKLTGSFDVYKRYTEGMLTKSKTLPAVLGTTEPQKNAANMVTTGFDMNIDWRHRIGEFYYGLGFILSDYTATTTKYDNPDKFIFEYYEGDNFGDIWGWVTGGYFKTDAEAANYDQSAVNARPRIAGDIWFVDLNKDGKIDFGTSTVGDSGDKTVIGNRTPRYSFGFRTNFEWKGFDLEAFLQGVGKRETSAANIRFFLQHYTGRAIAAPKIATDWWTPENLDAYFPRPILGGAPEIFDTQSKFLQNVAYIRLKQLTLGYTIPSDIIEKMKIKRMKIYISGSNLLTLTKAMKIIDPEMPSADTYPLYKSYSVGLNINF